MKDRQLFQVVKGSIGSILPRVIITNTDVTTIATTTGRGCSVLGNIGGSQRKPAQSQVYSLFYTKQRSFAIAEPSPDHSHVVQPRNTTEQQ